MDALSILTPILERFNQLFSENNLDELVSLYGPDAVMVTRGESCAYGREDIKKGLAEFTAKGKIDSKMVNRQIEGVGDHIILRAEFDATVLSTGEHIKGKFQQIFRKEGDAWLIIYDEFQG